MPDTLPSHPTEVVHDAEISPLVQQIVDIARREGLPLLISIGMISPKGGTITCDTVLAHDKEPRFRGIENRHVLAFTLIRANDPRLDGVSGVSIVPASEPMPLPTPSRPRRGGGYS